MSKISVSTLEKRIRAEYGDTISLFEVNENSFDISTPITFNDGDHISVSLRREGDRWILTDEGTTYMHLSLSVDQDTLLEGTRNRILSSILLSSNIANRDGELIAEVGDDYGESLSNFTQALIKISDINYLSKERVRKTFREDFQDFISEILPADRFQFDWIDKEKDKKGIYKIDCRVNQMKKPLFIHALANEKKVQQSIISTYQFIRWGVDFTPVAIFANQEDIGQKAKQQLAEVCPTQFSNLSQDKERIEKKLKRLAEV